MFIINKIKASVELTLLVFIMSLFIIGVGVFGVLETKKLNDNSKELFSDRLLPMWQLENIRFHTFNIISISHQTNKNQLSYSEALKKVNQSQDSIHLNWKNYTATYLTPEEKEIAIETEILIAKLDKRIENLKTAFSEEDEHLSNRILRDEVHPLSKLVLSEISLLINVQIQLGKTLSQNNTELHEDYARKFWWILIIAFIIAGPFLYYLIKKNESTMKSMNLNNAKLFLTEKNYRKLIEYAGEAIVILNEATEIIDLNDYAVNLLGYSRDELLKMKIPDFVASENIKNQLSDLEMVRKNKFAVIQRKIKKKNGNFIETEISNRFMDGKGFFVIIRDVTERKKFEDDLVRYNAELKKTNAELDRFVYSASHDLRAPLKSILGLINITVKDIEEKPTNNECQMIISERLRMMKTSAVKLDNFIDEILNYSRNARMKPESNEIDFENLVKDINSNFKFLKENTIDFKLIMKNHEKFTTDKKRLGIILHNILSNAYEYSDSSSKKPFVNVEFASDKSKAVIIVKDNGIGISANDKEKVFDMFYRSTSKSTGSGLGLYIVKEAVERLSGNYSIKSELGIGTEIRIEIPNR